MRRALATLAVLVASASASAASAGPAVLPGWPRAVPAGTVLEGPRGGPVVVSIGDRTLDGLAHTVTAHRRDGRRLWIARRTPSCGNCDDGPQPATLRADGTYGPIGVEGDDHWAVTRTGRIVAGCAGVVDADGRCVTGGRRADPVTGDGAPAVIARPPAGAPSVTSDERFAWEDDAGVPPLTARDGAGVVYAAFAGPVDRATEVRVPGLLMAVDATTNALLWTRIGPTEVITALARGVLVAEGGGITALGPDGAVRWARGLPRGQRVVPAQTVADTRRGRLYIGRAGQGAPGVTALLARTGTQVWRTRPRDRARPLSVGPGGRVYLAVDAPGRRAIRAVRLRDGATVWHRRTRHPVLGARELRGGVVAVSAGVLFAPGPQDRLTLLDPG